MALLTQSQFARRCGVSRQAIGKQVAAGVIPVCGPRRLIDPAEADRVYLPRADAGMPQLRLDARAAAADRWYAWGAAAARRLAHALHVDERQVCDLLRVELEAELTAVGLDIDLSALA
jgi:hypothetical protein